MVYGLLASTLCIQMLFFRLIRLKKGGSNVIVSQPSHALSEIAAFCGGRFWPHDRTIIHLYTFIVYAFAMCI